MNAFNPSFFSRQARRWNRALLCAIACDHPAAVAEAYKAKRAACMARARAYKDRDRVNAQVARYERDRAAQAAADYGW